MSPGHWEDIIYSITKYYIYISNIIPARDPKQCGGSGRIMSRMMMMMVMVMMVMMMMLMMMMIIHNDDDVAYDVAHDYVEDDDIDDD